MKKAKKRKEKKGVTPKLYKRKIDKKKTKVIKHGRGRPGKIDAEDKQIIYSLAEQGFTEGQICDRIGVSRPTLWKLKKADDKFLNALKKAQKSACEIVERSLFENATGYSHPDIKIVVANGDIHQIEIIKYYQPSVDAQKFYLKNRDPERWKDKLEQEITTNAKSIEEMMHIAARARKKNANS